MKKKPIRYSVPNTSELCEADSIVDISVYRARYQPNKIAYRFLNNGIDESSVLTYKELHNSALSIAQKIQSGKSKEGNVLLLFPSGLEYISAFFACLYAGVIAVPAYPVMSQTDSQRLKGVIRDAEPIAILTLQDHVESVKKWMEIEGMSDIRVIATDNLKINKDDINIKIPKHNQTIAFLQYTSGSTGNPKGVIITHQNLLHNLQQIYRGFSHSEKSVGVIWLPPYHDMGLIGGILQPLYGGFPVSIMSPMTFLRRPIRWLQAIDKYRATTSGGPNFAYDLCIKYAKSKGLEVLDLSCWKVAFTGAEPIRTKTLDYFYKAFNSLGFKYNAFYPCYGLAESALMVTGVDESREPSIFRTTQACLQKGRMEPCENTDGNRQDIVDLVGSGVAFDACINIINTENFKILSDNNIGEIWVKSKSVAQGYWKNIKQTKHTFGAYTDEGLGPYMRTGDLGFLREGQIYVTGRLKELIIINGRNYFPNDIEESIQESSQRLRRGAGTAFSIDVDDKEKLIIVQEVDCKKNESIEIDELKKKIVNAISIAYKIIPFDILLVKKSALPKTTSGKLKRLEIKRRYLIGNFNSDVIGNILQYENKSLNHPMMNFRLIETQGEIEFEGGIGAELLYDFSSHRLNDESLVPGAAYLEASHYIGNYLYGLGEFRLNHFSINNPCFFNIDEEKCLVFNYQLKRHPHKGWFLNINQVLEDGGNRLLSRCMVEPIESNESFLKVENSNVVMENISVNDLYVNLKSHGFTYGTLFKCVNKIEITESGVRGYLNDHGGVHNFIANPYVIDAGFQLFAISSETTNDNHAYLPVSIGCVIQRRPCIDQMICTIINIKKSKEMLVADIIYSDENNNTIIEMMNVKLKMLMQRDVKSYAFISNDCKKNKMLSA